MDEVSKDRIIEMAWEDNKNKSLKLTLELQKYEIKKILEV